MDGHGLRLCATFSRAMAIRDSNAFLSPLFPGRSVLFFTAISRWLFLLETTVLLLGLRWAGTARWRRSNFRGHDLDVPHAVSVPPAVGRHDHLALVIVEGGFFCSRAVCRTRNLALVVLMLAVMNLRAGLDV